MAWALNGYKIASSDFGKADVDLLGTYGDLQADGTGVRHVDLHWFLG